MYNKLYVTAAALLLTLFTAMAGCASKNVRHLASDVCLVTPEITTKEQVITYLGQPDEQYELADDGQAWIYYDVKKNALRDTPYIGDKIGDEKFEMVKVVFGGDVVQSCVYRILSEKEFAEGGFAQ